MPTDLRITVHFLQPYSHGRGDDGYPEWPPAPLRLFQALVAAGLGRQASEDVRSRNGAALRWLERQRAPEVYAPEMLGETAPYRLYVPDNAGDRVAKAWSAGREADIAEYRSEKDVRAMRIQEGPVHFVFRGVESLEHLPTIREVARSLTHLGWGIDMVVGDADRVESALVGERWIPGKQGGPNLRWATEGTLKALEVRHAQFLERIDQGTLRPVSPLEVFTSVPYARGADLATVPFAAFRLTHPRTGARLSFDAATRARDVAAWFRHAVAKAADGWPFGSADAVVHGHSDAPGLRDRLSFLPLPTITPRGVEGIGRVVLVGTGRLRQEIDWLRVRLSGVELQWNGAPQALLEPLSSEDWVLGRFVGASDEWSTVTPVVLPGHDDRSVAKASRLFKKALVHAGVEEEVVARARIEYQRGSFLRGVPEASSFVRPDRVVGPLTHVSIRFAEPRRGPVFIGSGRHRGLGIFAMQSVR